jgi:hypothetical protein
LFEMRSQICALGGVIDPVTGHADVFGVTLRIGDAVYLAESAFSISERSGALAFRA